MNKTQIIILAAGNSTRMKSETPKVLQSLGGKKLIEYAVGTAEAVARGLKPILVVNPRHQEALQQVLGNRVVYTVQHEQKGTGHAVSSARPAVGDSVDQIVVLYGDHPLVSAKTVGSLIATHEQHVGPLTMATFFTSEEDELHQYLQDFGRVVRDENGRITRIVEVKDATHEQLTLLEKNPAFFCFDAPWLWEHLPLLSSSNKQNELYLTDLVGLAVSQGHRIASITVEDPFECFGVNNPEQLALAHAKINS